MTFTIGELLTIPSESYIITGSVAGTVGDLIRAHQMEPLPLIFKEASNYVNYSWLHYIRVE